MYRTLTASCLLLASTLLPIPRAQEPEIQLRRPDAFTILGRDFRVAAPARAGADTIHVVVEIPAGTNAKWEVDKNDGALRWEFKNGRPRVVRYLAYPGNYGMVPRTLLAKDEGGDGDPLDVLVLGPAVERGRVLTCRLVGVLRLLDGGEQDDKLLAVPAEGPLSDVRDLADLQSRYPGITTILETWFEHYKGPGEIVSRGFAPAAEAQAILAAAQESWAAAR